MLFKVEFTFNLVKLFLVYVDQSEILFYCTLDVGPEGSLLPWSGVTMNLIINIIYYVYLILM